MWELLGFGGTSPQEACRREESQAVLANITSQENEVSNQEEDEAAIRALNDIFVAGLLAKDPRKRASIWVEDGSLVPPNAGYVKGRGAIEKHFESEAPEIAENTKAEFSNYRFNFATSDLAFVDVDLTIRNIIGPDQKLHPVVPVKVVMLAERRGGKWWVRDERAHFLPGP
jgi:uncharacterized protein (TIGR02246 family)